MNHDQHVLGVGETRRGLDALLCLASTSNTAAQRELAGFLNGLPDGGNLHINQHFDASPLCLEFGRLQGELQPLGRYLIPHASQPGKFSLVGWDVFRFSCNRNDYGLYFVSWNPCDRMGAWWEGSVGHQLNPIIRLPDTAGRCGDFDFILGSTFLVLHRATAH